MGDQASAAACLRACASVALDRGIERSVLYYELYTLLTELSAMLPDSDAQFAGALKKLGLYAKVFTLAKPRLYLYLGLAEQRANRLPQAHDLWQKSLQSAGALRMPYDEALAHTALAQSARSTDAERDAHAQQARQLFQQMKAADNLARLSFPI